MVVVASVAAAALLMAGLCLQVRGTATSAGPVYSLAQIQARLAEQPGRWLGRTLRLRALAQPCPTWGSPHDPLHCATRQPVLVDPDGAALDPPLPLAAGPGDPLLDVLRGLPLVGRLLPAQRLAWERPAAYRVRLGLRASRTCGAATCYQALLQDAMP
jgi:hypothetical protein